MATSKKTSSFRTNPKIKEKLTNIWGSTSKGASKAVDSYVYLRKRVLLTLQGYFNRAELNVLVDNQNGVIFEPQICSTAESWVWTIEDGIKLDQLDDQHGVDAEQLLSKLKELSDSQSYFFREEIDRFWSQPDGKLEIFLDIYASDI